MIIIPPRPIEESTVTVIVVIVDGFAFRVSAQYGMEAETSQAIQALVQQFGVQEAINILRGVKYTVVKIEPKEQPNA